jgi:acetyl esterase/lipase
MNASRREDTTEAIAATVQHMPAPTSRRERCAAAVIRFVLRYGFRPALGLPLPISVQRSWAALLGKLMLSHKGVKVSAHLHAGLRIEVSTPQQTLLAPGVILYLHGGGFCIGSPQTHRGLISHLAWESSLPVWVPAYRLAPEHPFPAGLQDCLLAYQVLLDQGYRADQVVLAGDSAGGGLALALATRLRAQGLPQPAALLLLSPWTQLSPDTPPPTPNPNPPVADPMLERRWLATAQRWYQCPSTTPEHQPLHLDLTDFPPMWIQVGEQEILLADSTLLAAQAERYAIPYHLDIYSQRWHVFQLQCCYLQSGKTALQRLARFARARIACAQSMPGVA